MCIHIGVNNVELHKFNTFACYMALAAHCCLCDTQHFSTSTKKVNNNKIFKSAQQQSNPYLICLRRHTSLIQNSFRSLMIKKNKWYGRKKKELKWALKLIWEMLTYVVGQRNSTSDTFIAKLSKRIKWQHQQQQWNKSQPEWAHENRCVFCG